MVVDMSDDEAEYYAVQKPRYLIRKFTSTLSDSELTDSFNNNDDEDDDSNDDEGDATVV